MLDAEECNYCHYSNFLLMTCSNCKKRFCENHIGQDRHKCRVQQKVVLDVSKELLGLNKCCQTKCRSHSTFECFKCGRYVCPYHRFSHLNCKS